MTALNIDQFSQKLFNTIESKNVSNTLILIQEFKENIKTNSDYVMWITEPVNLNAVQKSLTENLGIPQKAMMIKVRRGSSRGLRASFFLQAMENSLKRVS
jgi:hypothetical protein